MSDSQDLVGAQEAAALLGVSRQRVHALATSRADFPKPIATLASGRVWLRTDIANWADESGRRLKEKAEGS